MHVCILNVSSCCICLSSTFIQFVKEIRCTKDTGFGYIFTCITFLKIERKFTINTLQMLKIARRRKLLTDNYYPVGTRRWFSVEIWLRRSDVDLSNMSCFDVDIVSSNFPSLKSTLFSVEIWLRRSDVDLSNMSCFDVDIVSLNFPSLKSTFLSTFYWRQEPSSICVVELTKTDVISTSLCRRLIDVRKRRPDVDIVTSNFTKKSTFVRYPFVDV